MLTKPVGRHPSILRADSGGNDSPGGFVLAARIDLPFSRAGADFSVIYRPIRRHCSCRHWRGRRKFTGQQMGVYVAFSGRGTS